MWDVCFISRDGQTNPCQKSCETCQYYLDTYVPRIQFIHQIDLPAAICHDLFLWGGNREFAEFLGIQEQDFIGMGLERLVHRDSLAIVISHERKRILGDPSVPTTYPLFLTNKNEDRIEARVTVRPLSEPQKAYLIIVEPEDSS